MRVSWLVRLPTLSDPDENERAQALHAILLAGAFIQIGLVLVYLAFGGTGPGPLAFYFVMLALHIAQLAIVRAGFARFSAISHTCIYVGIVTAAIVQFGGLRAPMAMLFPPAVLVAGLAWNGRAAIGVAVVTAVIGLGVMALEARGMLPPVHVIPTLRVWGMMTGTLVVTAVMLHVALRAIHRAEQGRRELLERLQEAQRVEALGRLAGGVAHDFNNLLTVILGSTSLLRRGLDPGVDESADAIETAALRAADITRQLLAIGRKQILAPVALDLVAAVRLSERMMRSFLTESISLQLRCPEHPVMALVDRTQLDQVLMNLVINARDAMPRGGQVTITVRADGTSGVLEIQDQGDGIPEALQRRIFEPFFTTKERGKGTGLGLAIVRGVVMQSGGEIAIDSAPGAGTRFTLRLPRPQAGPVSAAVRVPTPMSSAPLRRASGPVQVLMVDDDGAVRSVAETILRLSGYEVTSLSTPKDALALAPDKLKRFDLLVTDVVMPGVSGPDMAEELVRRHPALRVVFASGYADDDLRGFWEKWPDAVVLRKPFAAKALVDAVAGALQPAAVLAPAVVEAKGAHPVRQG